MPELSKEQLIADLRELRWRIPSREEPLPPCGVSIAPGTIGIWTGGKVFSVSREWVEAIIKHLSTGGDDHA